ncbi:MULTISPECIES: hypothetical protein [unclassified Streptomyces]|uniref:hypothetical protein n=1 Tax=unclassified Streptomyces TaxID=2593676 RepID=UPI0037F905BF
MTTNGQVSRTNRTYTLDGRSTSDNANRLRVIMSVGDHALLDATRIDDIYQGDATFTLGVPREDLNVHRCSRLREHAPGQDEGIQVRHWTSWHRHLTLAMPALAFLAAVAVSAKPVRNTDPNRSVRSSDLIDLTVPEIRHLIALD